jgi:hypothetical protein
LTRADLVLCKAKSRSPGSDDGPWRDLTGVLRSSGLQGQLPTDEQGAPGRSAVSCEELGRSANRAAGDLAGRVELRSHPPAEGVALQGSGEDGLMQVSKLGERERLGQESERVCCLLIAGADTVDRGPHDLVVVERKSPLQRLRSVDGDQSAGAAAALQSLRGDQVDVGDGQDPAAVIAVYRIEDAELAGVLTAHPRFDLQRSERRISEDLPLVQKRSRQRPAPPAVRRLVQEHAQRVIRHGEQRHVDRDRRSPEVVPRHACQISAAVRILRSRNLAQIEEVGLMELLDLHLGRPVHRGALTLFPVWNGRAVTARGYDADTSVGVSERAGSPAVGQLVVTNNGSRPALLVEGELLEGGQQHRVVSRSTLLAAGRSCVLDVRCIEAGRWAGQPSHTRSGRRAPLDVRAATDQAGTWARISGYERRFGPSATHSLLDAQRTTQVRAAALVGGLHPLPFSCGLLVAVGGQPLHLEAYDSPTTLQQVWQPMLLAAALTSLGAPEVATPGRRARRFLDALPPTSRPVDGGGLGTLRAGRTERARATSLTWRGRAVHTAAWNPRHELVSA